MYSNYSTLYNTVHPQSNAETSHRKFLKSPDFRLTRPQVKPDFSEWKSDPAQWGPHLWYYLHFSAANYPDQPTVDQQKKMKDWLCSLAVTIPCKNCSHHFNKYIEEHKHNLNQICSCREHLFRFLVDIHNKVNQRKGKPTFTYQQAKDIYYGL